MVNRKGVKRKQAVVKEEEEQEEATAASANAQISKSVVIKGKASVDSECPVASQNHIYFQGSDVWSCMLNQTNVAANNNKFYLIQLLKHDVNGSFAVWMRWGRVGYKGQRKLFPCASLPEAQEIFEKKFSDKTFNSWEERNEFKKVPGKYDLIQMDYGPDTASTVETPVESIKKTPQKACSLDEKVQGLVRLICDIDVMHQAVLEMKYDPKRVPLGKLTSAQILAGFSALKRISEMIQNNKLGRTLADACSNYYTRIPHDFGFRTPPILHNLREVQKEVELLEMLGDISVALILQEGEQDLTLHPLDRHYKALHCNLRAVEREEDIFGLIRQYVKSTHGATHSNFTMEVGHIYECDKKTDFVDCGNNLLLWHGSRLSNWAGIIGQGLRIAPPEAPSTGYMFGKGIYFADVCSKSANYCHATRSKNVGLLALCQVSLGKSHEVTEADSFDDKLLKGTHSLKGLGKTASYLDNYVTMNDGTLIPMGPLEPVPDSADFALQYNEYVVYNPKQVRLRYLVGVNFSFK